MSTIRNEPRVRDQVGFTLIELMIVVAIIAIIASIAVPNLISSRLAANEKSALSTVRTIATAMEQFRCSGVEDINRDGQSEYGYIVELCGVFPTRTDGVALKPPILSPSFDFPELGNRVRSGYVFQLSLPGANGIGLLEEETSIPLVDPGLSASFWCLYAWPVDYGISGNRTYFVNQSGGIMQTDSPAYSGATIHVPVGAAYTSGDPTRMDFSLPANGIAGNDGNVWRPAGG